MNNAQGTLRRLYFLFAMLCGLAVSGPVAAQQMHDDGFELPWLHTRAEQAARRACENEMPECRDSVRRQLATEKMISRFAPWVALCIVLLGVSRFLRHRDKVRERQREEAARQHVRTSLREKEARADRDREVAEDTSDDDDDNLGMGRPGSTLRARR